MKVEDTIFGYVEYDNKDCPFEFSLLDYSLLIFPSSVEDWKNRASIFKYLNDLKSFMLKDDYIDRLRLDGILTDGRRVVFCVLDNPINDKGFFRYEVKWMFLYYNSFMIDCISGVRFFGKEVDYFYTPSAALKQEIEFDDENRLKSFGVKSNGTGIESDCGTYNVRKGLNATVSACTYAQINCGTNEYAPISASSYIRLDFSRPAVLDDIIITVYHVKSFFQYVTYRTNIKFNSIEAYSINKEGYKDYSGAFFLPQNAIENDRKVADRIIKQEYLKKNVSNILRQIKNWNIVTIDFYDSIDDKLHLTNSKIIMILSRFEGEFRRVYGKQSNESDFFKSAKADIVNYIQERIYQNTGKMKNAYKRLIKGVENSGNSFGKDVLYALDMHEKIMEIYSKRIYKQSLKSIRSKLAERMNVIRNDIAHNKLEHMIKAVEINDLRIMEIITYVIRLRKLGVSENCTIKAMDDLFF